MSMYCCIVVLLYVGLSFYFTTGRKILDAVSFVGGFRAVVFSCCMYLVCVVACQPMTVTNNKKVVRVRMSPWDLEMGIFNRAKEVADHRGISWRKVMEESLLLWLQAHPVQAVENTHGGTNEI